MSADAPDDVILVPIAPPGRPEPRNVTMADLIVLVAGFALAASIGRDVWDTISPPFSGRSPWLVVTWFAFVWTWRTSLAVATVALVRRWRYGGMFSPGEFVAVASAVGIPLLHLQMIGFFLALWHGPGGPVGFDLRSNETLVVQGAFILLAALVALLGRWRRHKWVMGLGLAVAWSALATLSILVSFRLITRGDLLVGLPARLVSHVPLVVALWYALRRGPRSLPWTDAAGLGICLLVWAASEAQNVAIAFPSISPDTEFVAELLAWGFSYALVRQFGAAFARWLNTGEDPMHGPPPGPDPYAPPTS